MDWDKLRTFHTVAESGSFTRAGEALNLSQSAISRQISTLAESLSASLFHRHARGLNLTEQGELLYRTVHDVFGKLALVESRLRENQDEPVGLIKVSATLGVGSYWLAGLIPEFRSLYPGIRVDLILVDHDLDLAMREADVALRLSAPRQPDLVRRSLFIGHVHIYASPTYLDARGRPQSLCDLDDHDLIVFGSGTRAPVPALNWLLTAGREGQTSRRPALTINNLIGMRQATIQGGGITALPSFLVSHRYPLERVLPKIEAPAFQAYFAYPEELRHAKKIQVFRDFLLDKIRQTSF